MTFQSMEISLTNACTSQINFKKMHGKEFDT